MLKDKILIILFFFLSLSPSVEGIEVYLGVKKSGINKINLGISLFRPGQDSPVNNEISQTINKICLNDLYWTNLFTPLTNPSLFENIETLEKKEERILFQEWGYLGLQALIKGEYSLNQGLLTINFKLYDLDKKKLLLNKIYTGSKKATRLMVHKFIDELVYHFTGQRGIAQTKISFVSVYKRKKEIYIMDYDGDNYQRLTAEKSLSLSPSWSFDGKKIAYTTYQRNNPDIYILDLEKRIKFPFSQRKGLNIAPAWSPNNRQITFVFSQEGNSDIYLADLNGSNFKRLTSNSSIDTSPSFSPDGNQIVFTSDRSGNPQIYLMNKDGSEQRRITYQGKYNDSAVFSPDGTKIAYSSRKNGGKFDIFVKDLKNGLTRQLTQYSGNNENPTWSPDGHLIAFSSTREGKPQIYLMKADGSQQTKISNLRRGATSPTWSPWLEE